MSLAQALLKSDPKSTRIDVDKVEKELVSALEADRKYSRENDAKFRAVHQKVASYEEFRCVPLIVGVSINFLPYRDIVKASHLTSLDRDDIMGRKGKKQPWNPAAVSFSNPSHLDEGESNSNNHGNTITDSACTQFNHVQEFVREWRRLKGSPQDRYWSVGLLGILTGMTYKAL